LGISRFKSQIRGEHRDRFLVFLFWTQNLCLKNIPVLPWRN
jgi:hypothetical protein